MSFMDEEGMLADNLEVFAGNVRARYAPLFAEARAFNRIATTAQFTLEVHPESAQDLCCSALFMRVLVYTQTALLLVERGLVSPARVMLRCAVEALFNLRACAKDYATAVAFMDADLLARRRTGEYLQQVNSQSLKAHVVGERVDEHIAELADRIETLDAKKLTTRALAVHADLEDWYLTTYAYLSSSVHSTVRDLEEYFEIDDTGGVAGLVSEPSEVGLELLIMLFAEIQSLALESIAGVFHVVVGPAAQRHLESLQALAIRSTVEAARDNERSIG